MKPKQPPFLIWACVVLLAACAPMDPNDQPTPTGLDYLPPAPPPDYCDEAVPNAGIFNVICPDDETPEFIASLQRAFRARNLYHGPITGTWTRETRQSLANYQSARGLKTQGVSLIVARELGLAVIDRPQ